MSLQFARKDSIPEKEQNFLGDETITLSENKKHQKKTTNCC